MVRRRHARVVDHLRARAAQAHLAGHDGAAALEDWNLGQRRRDRLALAAPVAGAVAHTEPRGGRRVANLRAGEVDSHLGGALLGDGVHEQVGAPPAIVTRGEHKSYPILSLGLTTIIVLSTRPCLLLCRYILIHML